MKLKFISFIIIISSHLLFSQNKLQIINANSIQVDIKEDNNLKKAYWNINPKIKLDIYKTSAKRITFYTDIDSITLDINPNKQYDFTIVLNKKDSARTRIVWVAKKIDILKQGEEYNNKDDRYIPKFTYQSKNNPNLVKIRKVLKLDSIAGKGNELSQIFNLMHWVHNSVKHSGSSKNPKLKNAIDLIKVCKTENRGINCRMMAIILNECYLSMGIKSRYIVCLPKPTQFNDCHVINMVYSTELKKWLWIDPTFDAYVMDDKGNLLSIREVRERLIKDKSLIINADANWNRTQIQTKNHYLDYYMAKNLYRLETPQVSEYNTETWNKGKETTYIQLLPLDGIEQTPHKREKTFKDKEMKLIFYKTNNPELFWAKPE